MTEAGDPGLIQQRARGRPHVYGPTVTARARRLRRAGLSLRTIAREFHCSTNAVKRMIT